MSNVRVEARGLMEKFRRLDAAAQSGVQAVVRAYTDKTEAEWKRLINKPVGKSGRRGSARSRPGQPPRRDTGRTINSIRSKIVRNGMIGEITTTASASDKQGRRYPWMLESGTKTVKKRPAVKKAKRKFAKPYARDMALAMRAAVRKAGR